MSFATASQTIGPYWHLIHDPAWFDLTRFGAAGAHITITGTITDGAGEAVKDGAVELWQASPAHSEVFTGYGRAATNGAGAFRFITIKPEPLPGPHGPRDNLPQAPHCGISILARGLLKPLFTRIYFEGEILNETDAILNLVDPPRRDTLIAKRQDEGSYHMNIRLQGEGETVFMAF
jgi:protocatechuate 3,4-dioxygenase alpha subunit